MKSSVFTLCLIIGLSWQGMASPTDVIFNGRAATALSSLTIYTDSTFTKPSFAGFSTGTLLEIIGETELEHEDDAQNQTFKWYQVKSSDGKTGWVFGDGLAVVIPKDNLDKALLSFYKKKMKFGTGFENAVVWMAAIEGHDNFHANALLNPIYSENYIVVTNHRGKSVHIHYGGESTQGVSGVEEMQWQELTGDEIPEMVLLRNNEALGNTTMVRSLELYSFQAGTIKKVFEERLNISSELHKKTPSPYKFLELDKGTIRVEYLEAKSCAEYGLSLLTGIAGASPDPCLEYVTYTYHWNSRSRKYQMLYDENRSAPQVQIKTPGVFLQESPDASARRLRAIRPNESIDVIRQQDKWVTERGRQIKETYFYVRLGDGLYGYIPIRYARFAHTAIAHQLDQFYQNPTTTFDPKTISCFSIRHTQVDSSAYNN